MSKLKEEELLKFLRIQFIGCQIEGHDPCKGCKKKKYCYLPQAYRQIKEMIIQHFEGDHDPIDKDMLREELKFFMAEKDLTIDDVAILIKKDANTVWRFLRRKGKPHDRTTYRIKKLLGGGVNE